MTELQSPQRKSFTAKAIFGLLLAVVMVAAFATAGAAENTGTPRSGELHVTKECSEYSGQPGGFCTITGSNLNAIDAGMKVIYTNPTSAPRTVEQRPRPRRPGQQRCLRPRRRSISRRRVYRPAHVLRRDRPVQRVPRERRRHLRHARRQPLCVGRNVQLHPTRPRQ